MSTLLQDIQAAFPGLTPASRDDGAIAAHLSSGRTKIVQTLGGAGLIMETIGPVAGAALLDNLQAQAATNSAIKWAMYLINTGGLDFGAASVRAMIQQLVTDPTQQAALLALAVVPDPVSPQQVAQALAGNI